MRRRRFLVRSTQGIAGLSGLALAACGGSNNNTKQANQARPTVTTAAGTPVGAASAASATRATGSGSPAAAASPAAKVKQGGTVRYADSDPNAWDLYTTTNATVFYLSSLVRDSLFETPMEPGTGPYDTTVQPALVQKFEQPDPLTYLLHLQPDVKYAQVPPVNGRLFDSKDVVYTLNLVLQSNWINKGFYNRISKVDAVDPATVRITMSQPYAAQIIYFASHWLQMYAPELDGKHNDPKSTVGTGMMIFDDYQPGVSAMYHKNPTYWRGPINIDKFELRIITDSNTQLAEFNNGNLDIVSGPGVDVLDAAIKRGAKGAIVKYPRTADFSLRARTDQKPFDDVRVRQAMSMAIDRKSWLQAWFGGSGSLGDESLGGLALMPMETPWALKRADVGDGVKYITYNPNDAKALLQAAGVGGGVTADMVASTYAGNWSDKAQSVVTQLQAVGFKPNFNFQDRGQFLQTSLLGQYNGISLYAWLGPYDPDEFYIYWKAGSPRNDAKVNDPTVEDLIEKQRTTVDTEGRKKVWADLQRYVVDKCFYTIGPIQDYPLLVSSALHNYKPSPFYSIRNLRFVWKD